MSKETSIKLFENKNVRSAWDAEGEKWYISVVDVVEVLTESVNPTAYWRKLKQRLKEEGNETVTNCHGLKLQAPDGKMRLTDVADVEQLFRLIQSILFFVKTRFYLVLPILTGSTCRNRRYEVEPRTNGVVSKLNAKNLKLIENSLKK
jgi:hypothetical protein